MGAPGCDDAPLVEIARSSHSEQDVTLIYPYYENPAFLNVQAEHLAGIPEEFRTHISLIVVDDGSPTFPAEKAIDWSALRKALFNNVRLFRIEIDVRWNWLAARNIGVKHTIDQWVSITDMDHVYPYDTLKTLVYGKFNSEMIYRYSRIGSKTHPHPNSWFMTPKMFWKIGGYDERMSGYYGSDGYYRRRCAATAPIRIMTCPLELHEYEGDSSTTRYKRKQPEDAKLRQIVRSFPKGSKPKVLSFPYHEVKL